MTEVTGASSSGLLAVTLTPGSIAPDSSFTKPRKLPLPVWAEAGLALHTTADKRTQVRNLYIVVNPH